MMTGTERKMSEIILASASPRRAALLRQLGAAFRAEPADVDETIDVTSGTPVDWVKMLARRKAEAVVRRGNVADAVVLAADTVVVLEGRVLGKPASDEEARAGLQALSGRGHEVITGFCLWQPASGTLVNEAVTTRVFFRRLTADEITAYIASGEGRDKAGGYGIQGLGAVLVERIEGCYFNVVGLPLTAVYEGLSRFGINLLAPASKQG